MALEYVEFAQFGRGEALEQHWQKTLVERVKNNAPVWEIRFAVLHLRWATNLVAAVKHGHPTFDLDLQLIRVNDIVFTGMNVETFFETGHSIRAQSPYTDTFALGLTERSDGLFAVRLRTIRRADGNWMGVMLCRICCRRAFPRSLFNCIPIQSSARSAGTLELVQQLARCEF